MHEIAEVKHIPLVNTQLQRNVQKRIKAHGGTGLSPALDLIEACHLGVCMKCSGTWGPLYLHIPDHYPGLASEQALQKYREEFHIPDDVKLAADWHRQRLSQGQSKRMSGPDGEKIRANLAQKSSGPHPERYGKTGLNPTGIVISSWEIAKRLTQGNGLVQVMKELGAPNHKLIQRRGAAMGLAFDTAFLCDQGEPFRYGALFHLRKVTGFEARELEKYVGLSARRSFAQREDAILNPGEARKVIKWRDRAVRILLAERALHVAGNDYRKDAVLRGFLPELPEVNRFLRLTIGEIRTAAREHAECGVDELCENICVEAQREQSASSTDNRWRKTLGYLWQAEEWIANNVHRLRDEDEDDGPLVREMIGSRYGATQQTVQNALRGRTEPITPEQIRLLIGKYAPSNTAPPPGRRKGSKDSDTKPRLSKAAALLFLHYSQPEMLPFLYSGQYGRGRDDAEAGRKTVQKFLSRNAAVIDREVSKMTRERARQILGLPPN